MSIWCAIFFYTFSPPNVQPPKEPPEPIKSLNYGQNTDLTKVKHITSPERFAYYIFPHKSIIDVDPIVYDAFKHTILLNMWIGT